MSDTPAPEAPTPDTGSSAAPAPRAAALMLDPHLRRVALMIGYMVIVAGFAVAFTLLWPLIRGLFSVLSPFLVAMVVAYLFNPVVNFVQRRLGLSRVWGVLAVNALLLLAFSLIVAFLIPLLTTQVRTASDNISIMARERVAPWLSERLATPDAPEAPLLRDLEAELAKAAPDLDKPTPMGNAELRAHVDALLAAQPADTPGLDEARRKLVAWLDDQPTADVDATQLRIAVRGWIYEASGTGWFPGLVERVENVLTERGYTVDELIERALGSAQVAATAQRAATEGADLVGRLVIGVLGVVQWLLSSLVFLVFVTLISFYLLIDFASMRGVIEVVTPTTARARLFDVLGKIDVAVGGFIRGQLMVAIIVGTLTTIGLSFAGMGKYALLIGMFAGFANLIPYLGSVTGATPAVLVVLFSDDFSDGRWWSLAFVIGVFVAIQMLESLVLSPYIVGNAAQLHPVVVILGLAVGAQFGILGALLALPVTCILRVVIKEFFWDARHAEWRQATGKLRLDDIGPRKPRKKNAPAA